MKVTEFLRRYPDYKCSEEQIDYALYLERCGQRFLIDFGFENAREQALSIPVSQVIQ